MTPRFWRFSLVALLATIIVAVTLTLADDRVSVRNLIEVSADKNTALAQVVSIASRQQIRDHLLATKDLSFRETRALAASTDVQDILGSYVRDLSITKVNIFNTDQVAVFSTDRSLVGLRMPQNSGIIGALGGEVVSDIVRQNSFNSYDQVVETQDLMQTYIPFLDDRGNVVGVFEVYSDVSPMLARISETRRGIVVAVSGILAVFYLVLIWLFGQTDQKLVREQAASESYLEQIESANATLENRVADRTQQLERAHKFFQAAIDGIPDPAIVVNRNYRITTMNKAARESFGIEQDSDEPVLCYQAMHGRAEPCNGSDFACTIQSGLPCKKIENRDKNGAYQQVEFRTTPLRNSAGEIAGAIEVAHDLNEREQVAYKLRQAKETAETASRIKTDFVATMSHEIRTPMNAVLGMTDLLGLTDLSRKQRGYIETIQSSGNMLLSLLDNILDFSKLGAGALVIQEREFSVLELLERVLEIMGHHVYSKGLELVGILDTDFSLTVSGDRNRLRQILVNLLGNAVKYSDNGEIIVRAVVEGETNGKINLLFSVADQGPGMSSEVRNQLFTPFSSDRESPENTQRGSGLGLPICKQLVEQMDGEIGVNSRPGEGTLVWFSVPVKRVATASVEFAGDMRSVHGKRVLTTHSSGSIDTAVCSYAMAMGLRCDVAGSDDDALERLRSAVRDGDPYAAIIIDIPLRNPGGLTLARRIRATDDLHLLPVVVLSPISMPQKPGRISSIGCIRCINKPILPSELQRSLYQLIVANSIQDGAQASSEISADSQHQLRVLIAEDNRLNRSVLTGMLDSLGCRSDCVEDGKAVLQALEEKPYDVILMDCQMPKMGGEEVAERIRGDEIRFPDQPIIIAVTANASPEHRTACLAAGMDDFIPKPIRLGKLRSRLQRWIALSAAKKNDNDSAESRKMLADLQKRTGSRDESFLINYIDLFLEDTAERLTRIAGAIEAGDPELVRRECHSLKGACLEFGVTRMGRYCDTLHDAAAGGDLVDGLNLLRTLQKEFERVRPVFEAEKESNISRSPPG
jgi:PAS domain S-box-containing protein